MLAQDRHRLSSVLIPWMAITLTATAGYVDVVGYMRFFHIFAANMSGNHIRLGMALYHRDLHEVLMRGMPIVCFAFGAAASELWVRLRGRERRMAAIAWVWAFETFLIGVVLAIFMLRLGGWGPELISLALLSGAMGLQNTSLRRAGALSVYTTHVTGALTSASMRVADLIQAGLRHARRPDTKPNPPQRRVDKRRAGLLGAAPWRLAIPLFYLVGAFAGAAGQTAWNVGCLVIPMIVLIVLAMISPMLALRPPREARI